MSARGHEPFRKLDVLACVACGHVFVNRAERAADARCPACGSPDLRVRKARPFD